MQSEPHRRSTYAIYAFRSSIDVCKQIQTIQAMLWRNSQQNFQVYSLENLCGYLTLLGKLYLLQNLFIQGKVGIANGKVGVGCDGRRLILKTLCILNVSVYRDPWIACPINREEVLWSNSSTVVLGYKWQLPRTNLHNVTVSPSYYNENYPFPVGRHRVTWTGISDSGSLKSCSFHVTVTGEFVYSVLKAVTQHCRKRTIGHRAYCSLRNEMKICSLRNENLWFAK